MDLIRPKPRQEMKIIWVKLKELAVAADPNTSFVPTYSNALNNDNNNNSNPSTAILLGVLDNIPYFGIDVSAVILMNYYYHFIPLSAHYLFISLLLSFSSAIL